MDEAALAGLVTRDCDDRHRAAARAGRMNGPQDLGGQMGFGPVAPEPDEPVFHADWERRAMALHDRRVGDGALADRREPPRAREPASGGLLRLELLRDLDKALERLLVRHGFVSEAELAAGHAMAPGTRPKRVLRGAERRA